MKDWHLEKSIGGMVFDTTASNSGWQTGAAVLFEKLSGRKLLYLPCRHHILEVILSDVWKCLFGETTGPNNPQFINLNRVWDSIPEKDYNFKVLEIRDRTLRRIKTEVISF